MNILPAWRWLIPAAIFASLFALIAWDVVAGGLLFQWDQRLAQSLHDWGRAGESRLGGITFVTTLGAGTFITGVGVINVIVLLARRDWQAAGVFAVGLFFVRRIHPFVKSLFERPRPPFLGWDDFSFPSGHAFASAAIYGASIIVIWSVFKPSKTRWVPTSFFGFLIIAIAASRPLYGVHYVSDVLAGTCLGLAYVCLLVTLGNPRGLSMRRQSERIETVPTGDVTNPPKPNLPTGIKPRER